MTKAELQTEFIRLEKLYGDKFVIEQGKFDLWHELVGELEHDIFHEAVNRHMAESEFAPLPANIIKKYNEVRSEWLEIRNNVRNKFDVAQTTYSGYGGATGEEDEKALKEVMEKVRPEQREKLMENIVHQMYEFLKPYSRDDLNDIPPFSEFIRGRT